MRFDFATAAEIVFGAGTRALAGERARALGTRAFVVTGRSDSASAEVLESLRGADLEPLRWWTDTEPTIDAARAATTAARDHDADVIVGCGGGSAIDLAKAVAALLANGGDPLDYVEVVGRGQPLTSRSVPMVAMPTTAGTGAEVTRNAVLGVPAEGVKVSLRSALMLPALAIVDPELTRDLPPALTAATGMDALTQLIEPYVSARANPITDGLCMEALPHIARSLRTAVEEGRDLAARTDMSFASLCSGIALANAGLGAVHGFAAVVGGRCHAPHGAVCAALLPHVMRANVAALQARASSHDALHRYATVAQLLTSDPHATAADGIAWVERLSADLAIPPLAIYGIAESSIDDVVAGASKASSMKANPIVLTPPELRAILVAAL